MSDPTLRAHPSLGCVAIERIKQDVKWGVQNHCNLAWFAILGEEFGEVAECVTESSVGPLTENRAGKFLELLEYELIQVAAVCVAWVECIRKREQEEVS